MSYRRILDALSSDNSQYSFLQGTAVVPEDFAQIWYVSNSGTELYRFRAGDHGYIQYGGRMKMPCLPKGLSDHYGVKHLT